MTLATSAPAQLAAPRDRPGPVRGIAALAAAAGIGAVFVSSCCVVPLLLAGLGLGGAWLSQDIGIAASWQPYLVAAAGVKISAAWIYFLVRQRRLARACAMGSVCARPSTPWITGALLVLATALVAGAILWGRLEPVVLGWLTS